MDAETFCCRWHPAHEDFVCDFVARPYFLRIVASIFRIDFTDNLLRGLFRFILSLRFRMCESAFVCLCITRSSGLRSRATIVDVLTFFTPIGQSIFCRTVDMKLRSIFKSFAFVTTFQ